MSDLSSLDRTFGLPPVELPAPLLDELPAIVRRSLGLDVAADEVTFRPLRGAREIARILHLREEIQLPAAAVGDSSFAMREKKETRSASSELSCGSANT